MPWYRTPDGMDVHINFGGGKRAKNAPPPCRARRADGRACGWIAPFLCDWKQTVIVNRPTCDRPICEAHAFQVEPDKHLCPEHQDVYRAWLRELCIAY